jgi:hypothetical protein
MPEKSDWYEILDVMLLLGHILKDDFKPDFVNTSVRFLAFSDVFRGQKFTAVVRNSGYYAASWPHCRG